MTCQQLIDALSKLDRNAEVLVNDNGEFCSSVKVVCEENEKLILFRGDDEPFEINEHSPLMQLT
jgi:hypothetical protein